MRQLTLAHTIITIILVVSAAQEKINAKNDFKGASNGFHINAKQGSGSLTEGDTVTLTQTKYTVKSKPYFQASIPMRILECIRRFNILHCTKLYMLQKFEEKKNFPRSGNITRDFLKQFFGAEEEIGSLVCERYVKMSDEELNKVLAKHFQNFFKHRDIKLHFLPGILVKIVPSKYNQLTFMLKNISDSKSYKVREGRSNIEVRNDDNLNLAEPETHYKDPIKNINESDESKRKTKRKSSSFYKNTIIQMAVPVMAMPAILMGSFIPFLLPVLKMATLMTMLMNNSAFIAALIYAARTHANTQDEQHIAYGYPGYH